MRNCRECNKKIKVSDVIKSFNKVNYEIICSHCGATYTINKPKLRYTISVVNFLISSGIATVVGFATINNSNILLLALIDIIICVILCLTLEIGTSNIFKYTNQIQN